jgi:hypothetical protein|tara:strand:+ start:243 stop:2465 length:2223 start_codon:yes stop_codon:yes gene_type:complete
MARLTNKKKADGIRNLYRRANNAYRMKWHSDAQESYEFYLGDQLSSNELEQLEESGMPTFTINRITPVIETMKFFVTSGNPRWQAVAAEGSDTDLAAVHSDIADYCWYLSNGGSLYGQVILDALVKGIGYFLITVDPDADHGLGEVKYKRIMPDDVYVDPMSRDFLFRDASYIIVRKVMSRTQLSNLLPAFKTKINKANSDQELNSYSRREFGDSRSITPDDIGHEGYKSDTGEEDQLIDYIECYKKVKSEYVNVFQQKKPTGAELKEIEKGVNESIEQMKVELSVQLQEKAVEFSELIQKGEMIQERATLEMEKLQKAHEEEIEGRRIMMINDAMEAASEVVNNIVPAEAFKKAMNNKAYSESVVEAIPFFKSSITVNCVAGDTFLYEYDLPLSDYPIIPVSYLYSGTPYPQGAVNTLIGKQQEINKAHQIMLHNANLASNLRWIYEEGSVPEEEWEQYSSSPGALLKYRQGFTPPTPVQPLPLNSAFFQITQEGKGDLEYISGISPTMQGQYSKSDSPETYRGLLAIDEFGTRRIKAWMNQIVEPALEQLGKIFTEVAQDTYKIQKVFRIVQPNNTSKETQINIPLYNDYGEKVGLYHDYQSTNFDIRIIAGSTQPINRWALLEEYFKWFQAGLIDDIAMIGETDIRNKEMIIQRKSLYSQLQGQLESLNEAVKDKDGTIETLERQLVQAGIKDKVRSAELETRKDLLDTEAQQKLLQTLLIKEQRESEKRANVSEVE